MGDCVIIRAVKYVDIWLSQSRERKEAKITAEKQGIHLGSLFQEKHEVLHSGGFVWAQPRPAHPPFQAGQDVHRPPVWVALDRHRCWVWALPGSKWLRWGSGRYSRGRVNHKILQVCSLSVVMTPLFNLCCSDLSSKWAHSSGQPLEALVAEVPADRLQPVLPLWKWEWAERHDHQVQQCRGKILSRRNFILYSSVLPSRNTIVNNQIICYDTYFKNKFPRDMWGEAGRRCLIFLFGMNS